MKRFLPALIASAIILLGSWGLSYAATSVFQVFQGGTGTSTPSGILYGNGDGASALKTVGIGSGLSFISGLLSATGSGTNFFASALGITFLADGDSTLGAPTLTATSTATSTIANFEGIISANDVSGADIGAKINTAYAALPSTGGIITVQSGSYSFSTPIAITTSGKPALIECAPAGATRLNWTGSATSTTFNVTGLPNQLMGYGMDGCSIFGSGTGGNEGSQAGIEIGGSAGGFGINISNVTIDHLGIGIGITSNTYVTSVNHSQFHKDGQAIVYELTGITNAGENLNFSNDIIADNDNAGTGTGNDSFCVNLEGNIASVSFFQTSFDGCQVYVGAGDLRVVFSGDHFENPGANGNNPYIYIATSTFTGVSLVDSVLLNDGLLASTTPPEFIWNAASGVFNVNNDTLDKNGGALAVANFILNHGSFTINGVHNLNGSAVTNWYNNITTPSASAGGGTLDQLSSKSSGFGSGFVTNAVNNLIFTNGGANVGQFGQNGNWELGNVNAPFATVGIENLTATSTEDLLDIASSTGTKVVTVSPAGFLGLSSSSPSYELTVSGSGELGMIGDAGSVNTYLGFAGNGAVPNGRAFFGYDGSLADTVVQAGAAKGIEFDISNTFASGIAAILTAAGNFGVGTSSPFARFSVAGSSGGTTPLFAISSSTGAFATSTTLSVDQNGNVSILNGATLSVSSLTSGNCVQASTNGLLTTTGSACGSGGGTNFFSNLSTNTFLNTGSNLQAPTLEATSTTATSTIDNALTVGTTSSAINSKLFLVEGNTSGGVARIQRDFPGIVAGNIVGTYDVELNEVGIGSLVDQAGPSQTFGIALNGGTENPIADLVAVRDGADTSGAFAFRTYNAGIPGTGLYINHLQDVGLATTSPGTILSIGTGATAVANFATGTSTIYSQGLNLGAGTNAPLVRIGSTTPNYAPVVNDRLNIVDDRNDYSADNSYNNSNGTCATADKTEANDLNSTALNFNDQGHTSSGFTGVGCANNPFTGFGSNSSYYFDPSGDMNFEVGLGNLKWFTGGYAASNIQMELYQAGGLVEKTASTSAFAVGANGLTNPALSVNDSAASAASGVSITGSATGVAPIIASIDTAAAVGLTVTSKSTGILLLETGGTSGNVELQTNNGTASGRFTVQQNNYLFTSATLNTAATVRFSYTNAADASLTTGTEAPNVYFNLGTSRNHATGALPLQRDFRITGSPHSFTGASTLTTAAAFSVDGPDLAGTNATISTSTGIYVPGVVLSGGTVTNSVGLDVQASSGGTNNYAISSVGRVLLGGLGTGAGGGAACLSATTGEITFDSGANCITSTPLAKYNIHPITDAQASEVLQLVPSQYNYWSDGSQHYGFIANAATQKIDPSLVVLAQEDTQVVGAGGKNVTVKKGQPLSFDYQRYTALLTAEVQIQEKQIQALGGRKPVRSMEENWQDGLIGILFVWVLFLTFRKR